MRLLSYKQLGPEKGIWHSRTHIWRLIKAGEFPKAVAISAHRVGWVEDEIDAMIQERAALRWPKKERRAARQNENAA